MRWMEGKGWKEGRGLVERQKNEKITIYGQDEETGKGERMNKKGRKERERTQSTKEDSDVGGSRGASVVGGLADSFDKKRQRRRWVIGNEVYV